MVVCRKCGSHELDTENRCTGCLKLPESCYCPIKIPGDKGPRKGGSFLRSLFRI
jgi:hypothetical protein